MISGLITGKVYGTPQRRTSKTANTFAIAKVRNPDPYRENFSLFGIAVALFFRKIHIPSLVNGKKSAKNSATSIPTGSGFLKVRKPTGENGESLFTSVIAFDDEPCAALLALGDGDAVSLAGTLTPKVWIDKEGTPRPALDIVASHVLSAFHVQRKRRAVTGE